jgi:hypothetical protein
MKTEDKLENRMKGYDYDVSIAAGEQDADFFPG